MILREASINDKNTWNHFVAKYEMGSFLQTWEWADFMATQKEEIYRFIVEKDDEILAVFFIFQSTLKGGFKIIYSPKGPVFKNLIDAEKIMPIIMAKVDKLAIKIGAVVFQCDPETNDRQFTHVLDELNFIKTTRDIQPRHTLILNIQESEENLLKQMHSKTRYNIRLADKKGVTIEVDNSKFKEFNELLKKTSTRQNITLFGSKYFHNLLKLPFVKLYLAKYDGKYIAANIMIFWNHTAIYLFGASDYEYRNVMAPHLLQWQAIKDAKDQDMWFYDFWGAAPNNAEGKEQNWSGFTKFKMGFSPEAEITEYIGTYEKVYSPVKLGIYRFLQQRFRK